MNAICSIERSFAEEKSAQSIAEPLSQPWHQPLSAAADKAVLPASSADDDDDIASVAIAAATKATSLPQWKGR